MPLSKRPWIGLVALLTGLMLTGWGVWHEPRQLRVRAVDLELPRWPLEAPELRVALVSDLHVGSMHHGLERLARIVEAVNATRPDVILFLGDLVIQGVLGGRFVPPEASAEHLRRLQAPLGVFGVMGNHDWYLDSERVGKALEQAGMTLLEDTSVGLWHAGRQFWLAGISDYTEGEPDLRRALRRVPRDGSVILLSHNPDVFPEVPERVALTVSGHTHGGQIDLPLVGPPFVPSRYGQRYARGHVVEGGRHLFVTVGTGTSVLPVRLRVPPEIVVLTLRPARP